MLRFVPLAAAVATSAMLLGATAGHAAQSRGYYVATALEAPAKANFVTRSTAWSCDGAVCTAARAPERDAFVCERSEEHTSELQSLMRISYAVFCLKKKTNNDLR